MDDEELLYGGIPSNLQRSGVRRRGPSCYPELSTRPALPVVGYPDPVGRNKSLDTKDMFFH